jgi:hypothetical protein
MNNKTIIEVFPVIIAQVTMDLAECVDCAWAVVMSGYGPSLIPLYTFGQHPDLQRCVAHSANVLSEQVLASDAGIPFEHSGREDWVPRFICPLRLHGEIFALLVFGPKNSGAGYTARDRDLITGSVAHATFLMSDERMAARIGTAMAQLQRTKLELDSARDVQSRCFPQTLPPISGLDYYGECQPMGEVGGDFFDFVTDQESSLVVSIGDVSGKGIPSAIIMAGVQATLRVLGLTNGGRISDLVRELNGMVWRTSPVNFYATLFYARIDSARRELHYVNAGHDRAILIRERSERVLNLESTGTVLGLCARTSYEQRTIPLVPGDVLVAVTDGITEVEDPHGRMLDQKLVFEAVRSHPGVSSSDLAGHIIHAVDTFTRGASPVDDRTIIVVRLLDAMSESLVISPAPIKNRAFAHAA